MIDDRLSGSFHVYVKKTRKGILGNRCPRRLKPLISQSTKILICNALIQPHLGPAHTYPDIFESGTFSFRIRLPSTRIRRIRQRIRKKINTLSKVEKNISATNPITCGRVNPDIFLSDDVKSVSSLSPNKRFNEQNNDCARAF